MEGFAEMEVSFSFPSLGDGKGKWYSNAISVLDRCPTTSVHCTRTARGRSCTSTISKSNKVCNGFPGLYFYFILFFFPFNLPFLTIFCPPFPPFHCWLKVRLAFCWLLVVCLIWLLK